MAFAMHPGWPFSPPPAREKPRRRPKYLRRVWTAVELEQLRRRYPHERTDELARDLGRPVGQVYQAAQRAGLSKTDAYLASPDAHRLDGVKGAATRFPKGHVPANKGLRRPGWAPGRMRDSQFQKGGKPHTWVPVGTLRINADGYLDRKVTDYGRGPRDWVAVHRLVWIEANGPVPDGHVVVFKPGRRTTDVDAITPDAVELVTRADLMARNTIQRYPPELKQAIRLVAKAKRKIDARSEHQ
ncbi:MAG: HNH endonuclease signature motif containing protein [Rhodospirillales bacterium]